MITEAAEPEPKLLENDDGTFTVDEDNEPSVDGGGDDEGDGDSGEPSRKEKRRARGQLREEAERLRQEVERERQERERMRADYERRLSNIERSREPTADPHDTELKRLRAEELEILNTRPTDAEHAKRLQQKVLDLRDQQADIRADKRLSAKMAQLQQNAPHPADAALQGEYSDVYSNQRAITWAKAAFQAYLVEKGEPATKSAAEQFLRQARERFVTGDRHDRGQPDERDKQRFMGMPRGGSGGGKERPKATISPAELGMAKAAYPTLNPADAARRWLKDRAKSKKS